MRSFQTRIGEAVATLARTSFPTQVILETVAGCNLACPACPSHVLDRAKGRIPYELAARVIDEIAEVQPSTELYPAFMGEGLLHPRFFDIVGHARERGLERIYFNTNAMRLDEAVAGRLLSSGVHRVIVSIDGHSAATYEARRVNGKYLAVRDNTLALLRMAAARTGECPEIWVQMIVDDGNAHEEEAFVRFWLEHGAVVKVRPQLTWGGRVGRNALADLEIERVPCPWLMRQVIVTWEGEIGLCDADHEAALGLGNVNRSTLAAIWAGLAPLRDRHGQGDFSHPLCLECDDWKVGKSEVHRPARTGGAP